MPDLAHLESTSMASIDGKTGTAVTLKRSLRLRDLVLYGMIVIQPVAPMPIFGILMLRSRGQAVTTVLLAMIAMLLTAISYGRMAQVYPSAGSAFTYVGKEINPSLGFITGWSMTMDYMLNPLICIIWCSKGAMNFLPGIPYWSWVIVFFLLFTILNLRGIKTSARINRDLAIGMGVVIAIFFVAAIRYILRNPHDGLSFFTLPFYDPHAFSFKSILGGTSLAVLTYIGFDGISTLSEEVENPKRNILLGTVLTCVIIGVLSALQVYFGQLIWPHGLPFPDLDTAFVYVAGRATGPWFFLVMNLTLMVASAGSGMASQLGAARLLFAMGRSDALPRSFFGKVDPKHRIPRNNVIFVGVVALLGAFLVSYSLGAEMLNFGALIAFMGVNAASLMHYYVRATPKKIGNLLPPLFGGLICFLLWINLSRPAIIAGVIWMAAGTCLGAWRTHGFRADLVNFEVPAEVAD
jgi:putrescine importer